MISNNTHHCQVCAEKIDAMLEAERNSRWSDAAAIAAEIHAHLCFGGMYPAATTAAEAREALFPAATTAADGAEGGRG